MDGVYMSRLDAIGSPKGDSLVDVRIGLSQYNSLPSTYLFTKLERVNIRRRGTRVLTTRLS